MSFGIALAAAFLSGFIALSYEILWFRVLSFVTSSSAASFGVILGFYLFGIAVGSFISRRFCKDPSSTGATAQLRMPAWLTLAAALIGWAFIPLFARWLTIGTWLVALPIVSFIAALLGFVLPLIAHFGIPPDDRAGQRLSVLYLSNIAGSSSGSLITGFVFFESLSLQGVCLLLTLLGVLLSCGLFLASQAPLTQRYRALGAGLGVGLFAFIMSDSAYQHVYERMMFRQKFNDETRFEHVIENRHGVIHVSTQGVVYGGGVYDGVFNVNPLNDRNLVFRAYAISAFHQKPKSVFMVGLASGSWAQILAHHPDVEKLTIVEINPGYLDLVAQYDEVKSLLENPKVEIIIDDGRRWLVANPDARFDVVFENATYHWRSHATNLLSAEFMDLVRSRLAPGGQFWFNTTHHRGVQRTACTQFKHGYRLFNFMLVGDSPMAPDRERYRRHLGEYRIDGTPIFDLSKPAHQARIKEMTRFDDHRRGAKDGKWLTPCKQVLAETQEFQLVTDDNMSPEFSRPWYMLKNAVVH